MKILKFVVYNINIVQNNNNNNNSAFILHLKII